MLPHSGCCKVNGELSKFVGWFVKAKKPSVSKLVVTGMPEGRGREEGIHNPKGKDVQCKPGPLLLLWCQCFKHI